MTNDRIRVLQLITSLAGGAGWHVYQLARHLDRSRFDVSIAFGRGYPLDDRVEAEEIPHHVIRWTRRLNPVATVRGGWDAYRLLKRERFDIVHVHCSLAGVVGRFAATLCRVPSVLFSVHAFASRDYQPRLTQRVFLAAERAMDRHTDAYCVFTGVIGGQVVAKGISTTEKIVVIPHGMDIPPAPSAENRRFARERLGLEDGELAVGTSGRLEKQKGIVHQIRAFRTVADRNQRAQLLILGDGPLRQSLENESRRLGLENVVRFLGWRNDLPEILSGLDVFCLSSLWETFGYSTLEAMAMALPIVATNVDSTPEVIGGERCGLLVEPANPEALAEGILSMLEDPERRHAMAAAARRRAETEFTLDRMIARYEDLYTDLAGAGGAGSMSSKARSPAF